MLHRLLYSPFLVQLVTTRYCNLSCGYCNEFDQVSRPVPLTTLQARIDRIRELGAFALELTGGEPMTHPHIYDVVRYARAQGFFKVMMISNAYLLNEEKVQALNEAGLQEMQISVDGVTPNEITVKVLKPMRRKLEAVARAAKFPVVLSAVVGRSSPEEVLEVVQFARDHGFRPRVLVLHGHDGQLQMSADDLALYGRIRSAVGERFQEAGDYRSRLLAEGSAEFKCRAGSRYLYVDEHGNVCWCSQTRHDWNIPLEDYTLEDLRRQFHTPKACNTGCTVGCVRTCSAPDEWRGQLGGELV